MDRFTDRMHTPRFTTIDLNDEDSQKEGFIRKRTVDFIEATCDDKISTDNIRDLLPTLLTHTKDSFRPISIEHLLKCCSWHSRLDDMPHALDDVLTMDHIRHIAFRDSEHLASTWVQPKSSCHDLLNDYEPWQQAPIYVQTRLKNPLEGHLICTYIWSGCKEQHGCWPIRTSRSIDVGIMIMTIYRHHESLQWQLISLEFPYQHLIVPRVPTQLFIEKDTHKIQLTEPTSLLNCHYRHLWKPEICRIPLGTSDPWHWINLVNFHF